MARQPTKCPYCGYEFRPPSRLKPGILRICGSCARLVELAGPPRLAPLDRREQMHRCGADGLPTSPTSGCEDNFRPSRAAIERFERCGC